MQSSRLSVWSTSNHSRCV